VFVITDNTPCLPYIQFRKPLFFRYRWEKNGKEFNWQVYDNRISQQPGRGTLVITQPKREDIGRDNDDI
jgi:hypothetical protein